MQFRARAGEDLINYPTGIDSKLARLLDFASMADAPPTEGEKGIVRATLRGCRRSSQASRSIGAGRIRVGHQVGRRVTLV